MNRQVCGRRGNVGAGSRESETNGSEKRGNATGERMPLRTYRRMKQESDKGKGNRLEFERADRAAQKAANYACQACDRIPEVKCGGRTVTSHHKILRSQGGTNDPDNLLPCCWVGHKWCHDYPALATQRGLIVRREGSGLTKGTSRA